MMLSAITAGLGFLIVLFIPGYLLSLLLFKSLNSFDRFLLSIGLSIAIVAAVGFLLSGRLFNFAFLSSFNVWLSLILISVVLTLIYFVRK